MRTRVEPTERVKGGKDRIEPSEETDVPSPRRSRPVAFSMRAAAALRASPIALRSPHAVAPLSPMVRPTPRALTTIGTAEALESTTVASNQMAPMSSGSTTKMLTELVNSSDPPDGQSAEAPAPSSASVQPTLATSDMEVEDFAPDELVE